jgi:hypothetical protein
MRTAGRCDIPRTDPKVRTVCSSKSTRRRCDISRILRCCTGCNDYHQNRSGFVLLCSPNWSSTAHNFPIASKAESLEKRRNESRPDIAQCTCEKRGRKTWACSRSLGRKLRMIQNRDRKKSLSLCKSWPETKLFCKRRTSTQNSRALRKDTVRRKHN